MLIIIIAILLVKQLFVVEITDELLQCILGYTHQCSQQT